MQGAVALILGAVVSVSVVWAGGLYAREAYPVVFALLAAVTLGTSIALWRRQARVAAVCLIVGAFGGPAALIAYLVSEAAKGNVM